jgi:RNA polymerase sigma factor (sigma-70 family)
VDLLPPRQREVVVLRVFQELTIEETATVLGIPEGTVKSNFAKAVASLRARLQERERTVEAECR